MKELGYLTLKEAESLTGIKADTLKKRCQEGKLVGAIKQGKTWFVPKKELIKPFDNKDRILSDLVRFAELGIELRVSLIVKGQIFMGDLISTKNFIEQMQNTFGKVKINENTALIKIGFEEYFEGLKSILNTTEMNPQDRIITKVHISNVKILNNENVKNLNLPMRIDLESIDGFTLGSFE